MKIQFKNIIGFFLLFCSFAKAHNQNPATIKKTVSKAFASLEAVVPSQLFRGQKSLKLGNSSVQEFEAKKASGEVSGKVFSLEFQERFYAVSRNLQNTTVAVFEDGSELSKSSWSDYSFVAELEKLVGEK